MEGKIYTFCLPDIGEGIVEGEVVEWLKKVGEKVAKDEPVVVVMTDKATVELPSPYPGKMQKHYYKAGEIAIKGKPLYDIALENDVVGKEFKVLSEEQKSKESKPKERKIPELQQTKETIRKAAPNNTEKVKAIPKVRHQAKEWEIDLNQIKGTGQNSRIIEEDLHHALKEQKKSGMRCDREGDEEQQLVGIRGLMAKRMHATRIPQFSYFEQVDATRLMQLRQNLQKKAAQDDIKLTFMPFLIRALSLTIDKFPQINASVDMQVGKFFIHKKHHIGIAMATSQGLIVPVLKDVEKMGFTEVVHAYEELKTKAVAGKLSSNDMKEATFTISNFGVLGGEGLWATPIISDPEVAILAVAKMRKIPVVKGENIVIGDVLPLSWSFDHRLIDGELAAQISYHYSQLIKNPALLI